MVRGGRWPETEPVAAEDVRAVYHWSEPGKPSNGAPEPVQRPGDQPGEDTQEKKDKHYSLTEVTGHEPFLVLIPNKLDELDPEALAKGVAADLPHDVLTPETPLVLVGPGALGTELDFPRAIAKATGRTVWTNSVGTSLTDGLVKVKAKLRSELKDRKHTKAERGFWIKEVPPDPALPENDEDSSIPTKGVRSENGRMVDSNTPDVVDETDLDSQPILFPLGRQSGGRFYRDSSLTRKWEPVRDGFDPTSPHFEYLPSDYFDRKDTRPAAESDNPDLSTIGLVPWNVSDPLYTVMTHATHLAAALTTLSEQPSGKKQVHVSGEGLGKVVRRRPSFRRMPPGTQIVLLACQAGARGDNGKVVAQELANATGRVVWASTTTISLSIGQGVAPLGILSDEHGTRGRWVRFEPGTEDPDTEQGSHRPVVVESSEKSDKKGKRGSRYDGTFGETGQGGVPAAAPQAPATREWPVSGQRSTADGSQFDVLRVPGDGNCLFTSILASAPRQLDSWDHGHLDVRGARTAVSQWFRGAEGTTQREDLNSLGMSPLRFLLSDHDLTHQQLEAIAGAEGLGLTREDVLEQLLMVLGADGPQQEPAWARLLERIPALRERVWVQPGDNDPRHLTLSDLTDRLLSDFVDMAVRNRVLWSTPFYDEIAVVAAHAFGIQLRVHDQNPVPRLMNEGSGRIVNILRSNEEDIRVTHYSAMRPTTTPRPTTQRPAEAPAVTESQTEPTPPPLKVPEPTPMPTPAPKQEDLPREPEQEQPKQEDLPKEQQQELPKEQDLPKEPEQEQPKEQQELPKEQEKPKAPPLPAPPGRMTQQGRIGAGDRVMKVEGADDQVVAAVLGQLPASVSASRREEIRQRLAEQLDVGILKPNLSRMTRGDDLLVPLDLGGGTGTLRISATLEKPVTKDQTEKFEFEDGGDSSAGAGTLRESRSRWAGGLVVSGKPASNTGLSGPVSGTVDRSKAETVAATGRMTHRRKTAEPVLWVDGTVRLDLDFSGVPGVRTLTPPFSRTPVVDTGRTGAQERPEPLRVPLSVRIVTPVSEAAPAGSSPEPTRHAPPLRVLQTAGLGGMDVVKDVDTLYGRGDATAGDTALFGPASAPSGLEAFGRQRFGDAWSSVRLEILAQLDLPSLQTQLRSMTAGELLEIPLSGGRGSILASAKVLELSHLRNTDKGEFNTGSDVTSAVTSSDARTRTLALGISAKQSDGGKDFLGGTGTGGLNGQRGSDRNTIGQSSQRTGTALKAKVEGTIFDGTAELSLVHQDAEGTVVAGRATTRLSFKVLVETAECRPPGAENTYRPDAEPGPLQAPELNPGSAAREPKPELWGSDPAKGKNGLPLGTVVLDVVPSAPGHGTTESVRPLREVLEALGRRTFGAQDWSELGPLVRGAFRHERLGALLTGMSHGIDLRSPLLVRTGERDALVLAGAKVQKLEYVREFEKDAELNFVNEWAAGGGVRENSFHAAGGQFQGGPEFKAPGTVMAATGGAGRTTRWRTGDRAADSVSGTANAKFAEKMVVYLATVELDVKVAENGGDGATAPERALVRALLAVPQSLTAPHRTPEGEGLAPARLAFDRPKVQHVDETPHAEEAPFVEGGEGAAGVENIPLVPKIPKPILAPDRTPSVQPPSRVSRTGELGPSDPVLGLHDARAVLDAVGAKLKPLFGRHWAWVEAALAPRLDETALRPRLSALTTGGGLSVSVSHQGFTVEVRVVRAKVIMRDYQDLIEKCEFERGGETVSSTGTLRDVRSGTSVAASLDAKLPYVAVTLGQSSAVQETVGSTRDVVTGRSEKEKTVERAARFTGDVGFDVEIVAKPTRSTVLLGRSERQKLDQASGRTTAVTAADFVFPVRELPIDPKTGVAPAPGTFRSVPERIVSSGVLSGSDVVLRVWAPEPEGGDASGQEDGTPKPPVGAQPAGGGQVVRTSLLDQLDGRGREVYGASWGRVRRRLEPALLPGALQSRLRALMAGQELFVKVPGGTVVLRWAGVQEMRHTADTAETEFATGGSSGVAHGGPDGTAGQNRGTDDTFTGRVVGTTDPLGAVPAAIVAGGTLSHVRGQERTAEHDGVGRTGVATKTKVAGSVFEGTAMIQVEMRRKGSARPVHGVAPQEARGERLRQEELRRQSEKLPEGAPLPKPFEDELIRQGQRIQDAARAWREKESAKGTSKEEAPKDGNAENTGPSAPVAPPTPGRGRRQATVPVELGFEVLLETSDTQPVPTREQASYRAPRPGQETTKPKRETAETTHPVPPKEVWQGLRAEDMVVDLPDVGSLRNLLTTLGRREFRLDENSAAMRKLKRMFDRGTLIDALPDLTAGGELAKTLRLGFLDTVSVTVKAELVGLGQGREEKKSEISQSAELATRFTERALSSRMTQLMGQLGVEFSKVKGKIMAGITFGGGAGRRTGGERTLAERAVANSKFPEPLVSFQGRVKFTFSFQHRSGPWSWRPEVVAGNVPVVVGIPKRSVTQEHTGPSDVYFTRENWRTGRRPSDRYDLPPDTEDVPKSEELKPAEPKPAEPKPKPEELKPAEPKPAAPASNDIAGQAAELLGGAAGPLKPSAPKPNEQPKRPEPERQAEELSKQPEPENQELSKQPEPENQQKNQAEELPELPKVPEAPEVPGATVPQTTAPVVHRPGEGAVLSRSLSELAPGLRGHWIVDPAMPEARRVEMERALARFPQDPGRFLLVVDTGADGLPQYNGKPVTPAAMVDLLAGLRRNDSWNGTDELVFVACGLVRGLNSTYMLELMQLLVKERLGTSVVAPDRPVWFGPAFGPDGTTPVPGSGHLMVSAKVGIDGNGRPVIETGGDWIRYLRTEDGALDPLHPVLGPYLPPTGREHASLPEHYQEVTEATGLDPLPDAIRFGTDDEEPAGGAATPRPRNLWTGTRLYRILEVAGDGDCLLNAVLDSARTLDGWQHGALDADGLRALASEWFQGEGGADLRRAVNSRSEHPEVAATDSWQVYRAAGDRELSTIRGDEIASMPMSDVYDLALRNRSLWNTPFYDEAAIIIARALGISLTVVEGEGHTVVGGEGSPVVYLYRVPGPGGLTPHFSGLLPDERRAVAATVAESVLTGVRKELNSRIKSGEGEKGIVVVTLPADTTVFRVTDAMSVRGYLLEGEFGKVNNKKGWAQLGPGLYTGDDFSHAANYSDGLKGLPVVMEFQLTRPAKGVDVDTKSNKDWTAGDIPKTLAEYDFVTDGSQFKFHPRFFDGLIRVPEAGLAPGEEESGLRVTGLKVKEGARIWNHYETEDFVPEFEGYLISSHQQKAGERLDAEALSAADPTATPTPTPESDALRDAPPAWPDDLQRMRYLDHAEAFERRLATYLLGREDVQREVAKLVRTAWDLTAKKDKSSLGTRFTTVTGMVGTDRHMLERVVEQGNIRERMALLYNGYTSHHFARLIGEKELARPKELDAERKDRNRVEPTVVTPLIAEIKERYKNLLKPPAEGAGEPLEPFNLWSGPVVDKIRSDYAELRAQALPKWQLEQEAPIKQKAAERAARGLLETDLNPRDVRPSLSRDEWYSAVDKDGRLGWQPGAKSAYYKLKSELHEGAHLSGGLASTGTSGTAYGLLQAAEAIRKAAEKQGIKDFAVDNQLLRLALLGWMLESDDHTFHEIMAGCRLYDEGLAYDESYFRYRSLAPLTEDELRNEVAPDRRFPDEHLGDWAPASAVHEQPPVTASSLSGIGSRARGLWIDDPAASQEARDQQREALRSFPAHPGRHLVAAHTGADGQPSWMGRPVSPEEMAELLAQDTDWNGTDELMFVSCNLASALKAGYVPEVLRLLKEKAKGTSALVPNRVAWFIPGQDGAGNLVVTSGIGVNEQGQTVVLMDGGWARHLSPAEGAEGPPPVQNHGPYLSPTQPDPQEQLPAGLHAAGENGVDGMRLPPNAVSFGRVIDNGPAVTDSHLADSGRSGGPSSRNADVGDQQPGGPVATPAGGPVVRRQAPARRVPAFSAGAGPEGRDLHKVLGSDLRVQSRPLGDGGRVLGRAFLEPEDFLDLDAGHAEGESELTAFHGGLPDFRHALVDADREPDEPGYVQEDLGRSAVPWAAGPDPYFVLSASADGTLRLTDEHGKVILVERDRFAAMVADDPVLADLPEDVPVVLLMPRAGAGGLEMPRQIATWTDRTVYAITGDMDMVPHPGGGWEFGLKAAAVGADGHSEPRGTIIRVEPPSRGGADPELGAAGGSVRTVDGQVIPDERIRTRTIPSAARPQTIGRASFTDRDWVLREGVYPELDRMDTFEPTGSGLHRPNPYDPAHAYFFAGHASDRGFALEVAPDPGTANPDPAHVVVSGAEMGAFLRRRPSVQALKQAADEGRPASVVLLGCHSAGLAQDVAEEVGLRVHAPTESVGVEQADPSRPYDRPQDAWLFIDRSAGNGEGEWRTFEPGGDPARPAVTPVAPTGTEGRPDTPTGDGAAAVIRPSGASNTLPTPPSGPHEGDDGQQAVPADAPADAPAPEAAPANGGNGPYTDAGELVRDLTTRTRPDLATREGARGPLGPDLFGLRAPADTPPFLVGIDHSALTEDRQLDYFALLDLRFEAPLLEYMQELNQAEDSTWSRPVPLEARTAWAPADVPPLPEQLVLPGIRHSIWLGGPLGNEGSMGSFREVLAAQAQEIPMVTLWTDVPRSAFDLVRGGEVPEGRADLARVLDMHTWAEANNVLLISVDEVFHAGAPMSLHEQFRTEHAKQIGPGYAAASDILRLEILRRFGGVYCDGDNRITAFARMEQVLHTPSGYALHSMGRPGEVGNDLMVIPRRHPIADVFLDVIRDNYTKTQRELYGPAAEQTQPGGYRREGELANRRYSTMLRTGPDVLASLADRLGLPSYAQLPVIGHSQTNSAGSWLRPAPGAATAEVAPPPETTLALTQRVVQTLVRELHNREGDLHLSLVAPVVDRHPQRELVWTAALRYLASQPDLARLVRTVTERTFSPAGETRVRLPGEANAVIARTGKPAEGTWWLNGYARSATLRLPADGGGHPENPTGTRVDELWAELRHNKESDVHWLVDPATGSGGVPIADTLSRFPRDDRFRTVALHSGPAGRPQWRGEPVTAPDLVHTLVDRAGNGPWDGGKPLLLASCFTGRGGARSYAADLLREGGKLMPDRVLEMYAPEGQVMFSPKPDGPHRVESTGPGHLVVTGGLVFDKDGSLRIEQGGRWVYLRLEPGETEPTVSYLAAHLPVDGSLPPSSVAAPDDFTTGAPAEDGASPDGPQPERSPVPGAVAFVEGTSRSQDPAARRAIDLFAPPGGADLSAVLASRPVVEGRPMRTITDYQLVSPHLNSLQDASPAELLAKAPFSARDDAEIKVVYGPDASEAFGSGPGDLTSFPLHQPVRQPQDLGKPELRVSGDGTLAAVDETVFREFYAVQDAVEYANRMLELADSNVTLKLHTDTYIEFEHEGALVRLYKVGPSFSSEPKDVCRDFSADVLGGDHSHLVLHDERPPESGGRGGTVAAPINTSNNVEVSGLARLAEGIASVVNGATGNEGARLDWARSLVAGELKTEANSWPVPGEAYGGIQFKALRGDGAERLADLTRRLGINEDAYARPGEGYVVQSLPADRVDGIRSYERDVAHDTQHGGYGYHFAPVVVASRDGSAQIALQNANVRSKTSALMREAVERSLSYHGSHLEGLIAELKRTASSAGDGPDDRRLRLAEAMRQIRDARKDLELLEAAQLNNRSTDPMIGKAVADRKVVESAGVTAAARAMVGITGAAYGKSGDAWFLTMHGRLPEDSFFEARGHSGGFSNPMAVVVKGGHFDESRDFPVRAGTDALDAVTSRWVRDIADHVAKIALWQAEQGMAMPGVTVVSKVHPEQALHDLDARADALMTVFHRELKESLDRRQDVPVGQVRLGPEHIRVVRDVVLRSADYRSAGAGASDGIDSVVTLRTSADDSLAGRLGLEVGQLVGLARETGMVEGVTATVTAEDAARMRNVVHLVRDVTGAPGMPPVEALTAGRRLVDVLRREFDGSVGAGVTELDPLVRSVLGLAGDHPVGARERRQLLALAREEGGRGQLLSSQLLRTAHQRRVRATGEGPSGSRFALPPRSDSLPRNAVPPRSDSMPRNAAPPRSDSMPRNAVPPRSDSLPRNAAPPRSDSLPDFEPSPQYGGRTPRRTDTANRNAAGQGSQANLSDTVFAALGSAGPPPGGEQEPE
ncbi:hypothetical protein [Kitasatospora sp. NPDC058478]|uniref:hypothetical protein n=1 Tax=Kitasatospora sp. NPDC058478 TaxID=3346520 RepID=UPI003646F799